MGIVAIGNNLLLTTLQLKRRIHTSTNEPENEMPQTIAQQSERDTLSEELKRAKNNVAAFKFRANQAKTEALRQEELRSADFWSWVSGGLERKLAAT